MNKSTIGVDVSKDHLDARRWPDGASRRVRNDPTGRSAPVAWIGDAERVVFEPTGAYHRDFERARAAAGLAFAKVNPRQARRFAEGRAMERHWSERQWRAGTLAKTDRVDAGMPARLGALLEPSLQTPADPALEALRELRLARAARIRDRTAAKNRAGQLRLPLLRRQSRLRLARIERDLAAIDAAIGTTCMNPEPPPSTQGRRREAEVLRALPHAIGHPQEGSQH